MGGCGLASFGLEQGKVAGTCEHNIEPSRSTICSELHD
jgi:hypothetical protein